VVELAGLRRDGVEFPIELSIGSWSGPDGEVLGREGNRYLDRMADSTMYMQQLIHDLIDLSRVGRSGVEPIEVDLRPLVQAIAEDAGAANPEAELRVGRLPVVTGDPDRAPGRRRSPLAVPSADRRVDAVSRTLRVCWSTTTRTTCSWSCGPWPTWPASPSRSPATASRPWSAWPGPASNPAGRPSSSCSTSRCRGWAAWRC
jgi:hypothetical protein